MLTSRRRWESNKILCLRWESIIGLFEVGEEELSQWRESHRESMKRERGRGGGEGAESHEEVGLTRKSGNFTC